MTNIVFCIPGSHFTNKFLLSWTKLITQLPNWGIQPIYSFATGSDIFVLRNATLGGDRKGDKNQPLFHGQADYDYLMWLDSDMVFTPEHFHTLFTTMEKGPKISILSGLYTSQAHLENFSAAVHITRKPLPHSTPDGYITEKTIKGKKKPFEVDFSGLGFMLVRKGVYEALDYPWFVQMRSDLPDVYDITGEDTAFCLRARDAGFKTYVHPEVIVGHEKMLVI